MKRDNCKAYGMKAQGKIVKCWDFNKAVKETRTAVRLYKKMTVKLLRKLYIANKHLYGQTWSDFCTEIGMNQKTVNSWLRIYKPSELQNAGKTKKEKL